ncbi:hypothetical protein MHK_007410, partial [Candidatus Magnetomorum sp. HK-1]
MVRNDIRSGVDSYIHNSKITSSGNVHVSADESAIILATDESLVESSGNTAFGGISLALNGTIAVNLVLSHADAHIKDSIIATTNNGNVRVDAKNTSEIDATINS